MWCVSRGSRPEGDPWGNLKLDDIVPDGFLTVIGDVQ